MKKMNKMNKSVVALILILGIIFASAAAAYAIVSDGGNVTIQTVTITNSDQVAIQGTLWIPKSATAENPAPAIISCSGGNTVGSYYLPYQMELARRGYVVFSWDYEGVGGTEMGTDSTKGALAVKDYVLSLDFVDHSKLGTIGHSAGGSLANSILSDERENPDIQLSAFFSECLFGSPSEADLVERFSNIHLGLSWGRFDENAMERDWNTRDTDHMILPEPVYKIFGIEDGEQVQLDQWYHDQETGASRIMVAPSTTHCFGSYSPLTLKTEIKFFDTVMMGRTDSDYSLHAYWALLFLAVTLIGIIALMFPLCSMLLDTKFFSSLIHPVPEATAKLNLSFFAFLILPGVLMAFIAPKVTYWANFHGPNDLPAFFPVQNCNATTTFFLVSCVIVIAIALLRAKFDKSMDVKALSTGYKDSWGNLGKGALLALTAFGGVYAVTAIIFHWTGLRPMLCQYYLYSMTPERWVVFPVYFFFTALTQLVIMYFNCTGLRVKGHEKAFPVMVYIANTIPAWGFNFYVMYKTVVLQKIGVNGPAESRPYSALLGLVYIWVFGAKVSDYFYKKTGNYIVPAMINTAIITWLSIAAQAMLR